MKSFLAATLILLTVANAFAQANVPARLAILCKSADAAAVADILTAEFSSGKNLSLLERHQIEKIYHEQALAAGGKNFLQLGQVLGADGLLLLEKDAAAAGEFLRVQLVAVKPGVVLASERFAWPLKNPAEWAAALARHWQPLWPKLGVLPADAVPVSVVNLRSAIQSAAARELERQLTLLAVECLSREPQLFVLERRRLNSLAAEKDLKLDDSAFWNGSYLLDGTLDNAGFSPNTLTISARLVPPKGGAPVAIEVSGSRADLSEVINRLAEKILATLKPGAVNAPWNAADEAEQFYAEAQWAMKWDLFPAAQAAAESAWALGKKTSDAAALLVRSYAESVPESGINASDLRVLQIPEADGFAPLDRGLEFFSQHAAVLFAETNSVASFKLGLRLLRPAFGLLESFYYAAELRAEHAEELMALREKVRRAMQVMDAHIPPPEKVRSPWRDPEVLYAKLKWDEGGAAFERPEEALDFYRAELAAGAHPEQLPRLIGWTWSERQRVPIVRQRLVDEACASTNVAMRLEGFFLALQLAPDDEPGSLRRAEEALESALWENRAQLFSDVGSASLVERTRLVLCRAEDYSDIYHVFAREPFASFKHRLQMDFLATDAGTNRAVLDELFPNTNVKMETPEQARELLPLMTALQARFSKPRLLEYKLAALRRNAGVADVTPKPAPAPPIAASGLVEATFVPWNISGGEIFSGRKPQFAGMILRHGELWVRVRYVAKEPPFGLEACPTSYLAVNPRSGVRAEISFPEKLGFPGDLFEVSSNALFVAAGEKLFQYAFREKVWTEISVPMEGATKLVWLNGRLFVGRSDGLLAVETESKTVQLLVSARRTPAANAVDPLWTPRTQIYPQADGRLGALAEKHRFTFDPAPQQWRINPLPLAETKNPFSIAADYFSVGGAQRLLTGPVARRYLVGFWNDGSASESLLSEATSFRMPASPAEKLLLPVRWDWPTNYPLEHSQITAGEKTLWALAPRKIWPAFQPEEPVAFTDQRQATVFCFTPDFRAPLAVAIRLPTSGLGELPAMNGQPGDIFEPRMYGYMTIFERLNRRVGNMAFWLRTTDGLVFGGPNFCGHWFISDAALEEKFKPQRAARPEPAKP